MNARLIGHEQPHRLHPSLTARILSVALAGLVLVLALFLCCRTGCDRA